MTWLKQNWFKISILIVSVILTFSIREYLLDKNEIYAESEYFECIAREYSGRLRPPCEDIKNYKIKFNK